MSDAGGISLLSLSLTRPGSTALHVGEQHRELLALAFEGGLRLQDFSARCLGV
jgi:hypothetical protein